VAASERPVLLFSGGKDSAVLLRHAVKASSPAPLPFPVMHVGTGHNFPEVLDFRDRTMAELGANPVVASVQEATDQRCVRENPGESRNRLRRTHRVFPISDWTEMDVCDTHSTKASSSPSIHFSHKRRVCERDGMLMADGEYLEPTDSEEIFEATVRFRTVGDMSCTGAFASPRCG
jgi:sulfate adenylyltransferase subunit 2